MSQSQIERTIIEACNQNNYKKLVGDHIEQAESEIEKVKIKIKKL